MREGAGTDRVGHVRSLHSSPRFSFACRDRPPGFSQGLTFYVIFSGAVSVHVDVPDSFVEPTADERSEADKTLVRVRADIAETFTLRK